MRKFYALISMLAIGISSLTAGVTLKEFNPKSIRQVDLQNSASSRTPSVIRMQLWHRMPL